MKHRFNIHVNTFFYLTFTIDIKNITQQSRTTFSIIVNIKHYNIHHDNAECCLLLVCRYIVFILIYKNPFVSMFSGIKTTVFLLYIVIHFMLMLIQTVGIYLVCKFQISIQTSTSPQFFFWSSYPHKHLSVLWGSGYFKWLLLYCFIIINILNLNTLCLLWLHDPDLEVSTWFWFVFLL